MITDSSLPILNPLQYRHNLHHDTGTCPALLYMPTSAHRRESRHQSGLKGVGVRPLETQHTAAAAVGPLDVPERIRVRPVMILLRTYHYNAYDNTSSQCL